VTVPNLCRPDPNADTLDQFDLVSIDLVDKRPVDAAGGAAVRPPSPSGIALSKYGERKFLQHFFLQFLWPSCFLSFAC
jgi:hypothetical protein